MKKLLLLILFVLSSLHSFSQTDLNLTEKEKDTAWEFIRQRFFNDGFETSNFPFKILWRYQLYVD